MKKNVDGIQYELRNTLYGNDGKIVSSEIYATSEHWNSYSETAEKMMNRISHHLDSNLSPYNIPMQEHVSIDSENRRFVSELLFKVEL